VAGNPRPSPSETPELLANRYELVGEVARGGCGAVYEAHDHRRNRLVAIKILQPSSMDRASVARFAREARVGAAMRHPNVCAVLDAGTLEDGRQYIAMERLHGETLRAYVARVRRLDAEEAIEIAVQILSGLDAAHDLGIVHRDVKPENVFLVRPPGCLPQAKLLDFGMCRVGASRSQKARPPSRDLGEDKTLTRVGSVVGTPEYMAPEQASGRRQFDLRIDLYAVGVILYEMLTGTRAFFGPDPRAVLVNVLVRQLPSVRALRPDLPLALDRIVSRAVERDPRARYASATELQHELLLARTAMRRQRAARALAEQRRRAPAAPAAAPPLAPPFSVIDLSGDDDDDSDGWDVPTRQLNPLRRSG